MLTSVSNITNLLTLIVRMSTELEMNMNSVERMLEYTDEPGEIDTTVPAVRCGLIDSTPQNAVSLTVALHET